MKKLEQDRMLLQAAIPALATKLGCNNPAILKVDVHNIQGRMPELMMVVEGAHTDEAHSRAEALQGFIALERGDGGQLFRLSQPPIVRGVTAKSAATPCHV